MFLTINNCHWENDSFSDFSCQKLWTFYADFQIENTLDLLTPVTVCLHPLRFSLLQGVAGCKTNTRKFNWAEGKSRIDLKPCQFLIKQCYISKDAVFKQLYVLLNLDKKASQACHKTTECIDGEGELQQSKISKAKRRAGVKKKKKRKKTPPKTKTFKQAGIVATN